MEPQIVLKIDNNHILKASNFKIFPGGMPPDPPRSQPAITILQC